MSEYKPAVYIVDDDPGIRSVIRKMVSIIGVEAQEYGSGVQLLDAFSDQFRGCLILDIWLPDMTGIELYEELIRRKMTLPVIVISGHGDIPITVQAIKKGAIDFLEKPFQNSVLLTLIRDAIEWDKERWEEMKILGDLRTRYEQLTNREHEIVELLTQGKQNKEIARELNISPRTVETHRANIMEKLGVRSISNLIQTVLKVRSMGCGVGSFT